MSHFRSGLSEKGKRADARFPSEGPVAQLCVMVLLCSGSGEGEACFEVSFFPENRKRVCRRRLSLVVSGMICGHSRKMARLNPIRI